jgi:hypothetical protein
VNAAFFRIIAFAEVDDPRVPFTIREIDDEMHVCS